MEARAGSRAQPDTDSERQAEAEFIESAVLDHGNVYDRSEIEVVDLGSLQYIGPTDTVLESVEVTISEGEVEIEATALPGKISGSTPNPGYGYSVVSSGDWQLTFKGKASGLFTWEKRIMTSGDKDPAKDYWSYIRGGFGQPVSVTGYDARIALLYLRNYPTNGTYAILRNWTKMSPTGDFEGNCDSTEKTITASYFGIGGEITFKDCAQNDVAFNPDIPGEMRIQMSQGSHVSQGGNIGTGYVAMFAVKQGAEPYFHDQQKMMIVYNSGPYWPSADCTTINADKKTC